MFGMFARRNATDLSKKPSYPLVEQSNYLYNVMYDSHNKQVFDFGNTGHVLKLKECTDMFSEKLKSLKYADYKMAAGFSVGVAAFVVSFFFPVTLVMWAGLVYGAYYLALRQQLFTEYTQSLQNAMNALKWSAGEVKSQGSVLKSEGIVNLVKALIPVTTEQQLFGIIDDKVEDKLVKTAQDGAEEPTFGDLKLDKEQKKLYYTMYGYDQANLIDIIPGIGHLLVNVGHAIADGFNSAKNTMFPTSEPVIEHGTSPRK